MFCSCHSLLAQKQWTLRECISFGLENNLNIKKQEIYLRIQENALTQSKATRLPRIYAGFDIIKLYGRSLDPFTNQFTNTTTNSGNLFMNASMTLYGGQQISNFINENKARLKVSQQNIEKYENDISLLISNNYLQILLAKEILASAESQLLTTTKEIERIEKLVIAGSVNADELARLNAVAADEDFRVIEAQNSVNQSLLQLSQVMFLETAEGFDIAEPNFVTENISLPKDDIKTVYENALSLPEIHLSEYLINSNELNLKFAKGITKPKLTLSATFVTGYSDARKRYAYELTGVQTSGYVGITNESVFVPDFSVLATDYPWNEQFADNQNLYLTLRLTIPIFDKLKNKKVISQSKVNLHRSQLQNELVKDNLYKNVTDAHSNMTAAYKNYLGTQKKLLASQAAFENQKNRFTLGLSNSIDFEKIKNQLQLAGSENIKAKYQFIFARSIIDYYAGRTVKSND